MGIIGDRFNEIELLKATLAIRDRELAARERELERLERDHDELRGERDVWRRSSDIEKAAREDAAALGDERIRKLEQELADARAATSEIAREMERRGEAIADAMGRYRGCEPLIEAVKRLSNNYHNVEAQLSEARRRIEELEAALIEERVMRMKVEFRVEHRLDDQRGYVCYDARHTWTDDQWREAARQTGGGEMDSVDSRSFTFADPHWKCPNCEWENLLWLRKKCRNCGKPRPVEGEKEGG